jgi:hypothetical protein
MKTLETVSGTFVRHNWKDIIAGVAAGKCFLVENHGRKEALVISPETLEQPQTSGFDLDEYFAGLKKQPKISLEQINATLARSPEL